MGFFFNFKIDGDFLAISFLLISFFFFFFVFCCCCCYFLGRSRGIWRFPGQGLNRSCSHRPTPEPQQCGIRAASATYTTAHGNAGSLTHWARAGTEPATSCFLVRFVNHWATMGTPQDFECIMPHPSCLQSFCRENRW